MSNSLLVFFCNFENSLSLTVLLLAIFSCFLKYLSLSFWANSSSSTNLCLSNISSSAICLILCSSAECSLSTSSTKAYFASSSSIGTYSSSETGNFSSSWNSWLILNLFLFKSCLICAFLAFDFILSCFISSATTYLLLLSNLFRLNISSSIVFSSSDSEYLKSISVLGTFFRISSSFPIFILISLLMLKTSLSNSSSFSVIISFSWLKIFSSSEISGWILCWISSSTNGTILYSSSSELFTLSPNKNLLNSSSCSICFVALARYFLFSFFFSFIPNSNKSFSISFLISWPSITDSSSSESSLFINDSSSL